MVTVVEGDQKAPFSTATTPDCIHFTLDTYLISLSVKQGGYQVPF